MIADMTTRTAEFIPQFGRGSPSILTTVEHGVGCRYEKFSKDTLRGSVGSQEDVLDYYRNDFVHKTIF